MFQLTFIIDCLKITLSLLEYTDFYIKIPMIMLTKITFKNIISETITCQTIMY